ncbi:MAG: hypothetical protein RL632_431 [Bacteroidota bacterium]|jgi:hypothetical protein
MLNLTDIAQRIAHPEKCEISDFEDLKSFAAQYPYCQVFPILSLKALANNNDLRFDVELGQFAYRISDRTQLYTLIHQNGALSMVEKSVVEEEEKVETTPPLRIVREDEADSADTETIDLDTEETQPDEQKETTLPIGPAHEISSETTLDETEDENDSEFIPLNISSSEDLIVTEEIQQEEEEIETESDASIHEESEDPDTEEDPEEETAELDAFEQLMLAETISSAYRLEELDPEDEETFAEVDTITSEEEVETLAQNRSFSDWLRIGNQSSTSDIEEDKSKLDDILDRFIENEPKISRPTAPLEDKPKRPFYSPERKAKESVDMQHMPVSETLGKIFELQGNYPKAIFVYEQLLLANPEKKSYFAARIEELNKKINS